MVALLLFLLAFLFGSELWQRLHIFPSQHRLVRVQLQIGILFDRVDDLRGLCDAHFLHLVAVEEAFDVDEVVPALLESYLLAETWS